jgi:hypothetical protein
MGNCSCCGKDEARFFHSACCGVHFEGVILPDGTYTIACEKCGKHCGTLKLGEKK